MTRKKNDELLDLVNEKDEVIGTVWKSEAHGNPKLIHREVALVVSNEDGDILFQKKSLNKEYRPGGWTVSVAGHPFADEPIINAIKREAKEELGIQASSVKLLNKKLISKNSESRFIYVFKTTLTRDYRFKVNELEVLKVKWISQDKLDEFYKSNDIDPKGSTRKILNIYFDVANND